MSESDDQTKSSTGDGLVGLVQRHFQSSRDVRLGICLLNAGAYDQAAAAFAAAACLDASGMSLPSYLAACHVGRGKFDAAAGEFRRASENAPHRADPSIREALALQSIGRKDDAVVVLRRGIAVNSENAELHFQLGVLLAAEDDHEEAELRFTQAINLDRNHTEAHVTLGMCCGVRGAPDEALEHLRQAQSRRPRDARIGMLLAHAAKAARQQGHTVGFCASMPDDEPEQDALGMAELSQVIEEDADFVDAFLSIRLDDVQEGLFGVLLGTIRVALERQPEHAELHFHCGRVLDRLGRRTDAIDANEEAVRLNPRFTRALIELAKLYQATDRRIDAATRLEQAVAAGAEYADVYFMLGNLYRDRGDFDQARGAYGDALRINSEYVAAQEALATLRK
ncbi:MAG: tetratricopeptide repeat protein [Planctomycetes bacterium]|nr:tetratricopeptide repeat protein [Planctomycetota bacterium]